MKMFEAIKNAFFYIDTSICQILALLTLSVVVLIGILAVGNRHLENVQNIENICNELNIRYSTHTNCFGNVTKIHVKKENHEKTSNNN